MIIEVREAISFRQICISLCTLNKDIFHNPPEIYYSRKKVENETSGENNNNYEAL